MLHDGNQTIGNDSCTDLNPDRILCFAPEFSDLKMLLHIKQDMSLQNGYQVTQTFAISKLPKHQSKELVLASEVLDITVTRVFASQVVEVIPVEKCHQLSKNVFVLIHMRSVVLTAKIHNQIR